MSVVLGFDILWYTEGTQGKAARVVETELLSCVHYLVQNGCARPEDVPEKEVEVHDPGRGAQYQELSVSKVAGPVRVSEQAATFADWHAPAEQFDGTVVAAPLFDATHLHITFRVQGLVRQPADADGRG